jgi:recombination protein RecT
MSNNTQALQKYLGTRTKSLAAWAQGMCDPAQLVRFALLDYSTSTQLQKCSHESIYLSLIAAAQVGLAPDGVESSIVPYSTTATWQPMYQGLIRKALEHPDISSLYAVAVYENDTFEAWQGTCPRIDHKLAVTERGDLCASYAVARMASGDPLYEVLTGEDLTKIRARAADGSAAWKDFPGQMARKSAIKRIAKYLPRTTQFAQAVRLDDLATTGDIAGYRQVIDVPANDGVSE